MKFFSLVSFLYAQNTAHNGFKLTASQPHLAGSAAAYAEALGGQKVPLINQTEVEVSRLVLVVTIFYIFLLTACSSLTTTQPASTVLPTPTTVVVAPSTEPTSMPVSPVTPEIVWSLYEKPKAGFTISLPTTWQQVDIDPNTFETTIEVFKKQNPQAASQLEQKRGFINDGFVFFGFEQPPGNTSPKFLNNITIFIKPINSILRDAPKKPINLALYEKLYTGYLSTLDYVKKPIWHQQMDFPAGETVRVLYRVRDNSQVPLVNITEYHIKKDDQVYALTLSTIEEYDDPPPAQFEEIGKSFQFIE